MPNYQARIPQHGTPTRLPQRTGQPPQNDFRVGEVRGAPLVALALSDVLDADRQLTAGTDIEFTDLGPKGALSFKLTLTGVAPSTYGAALKVPIIQVDNKGRVIAASEATLGTAAGMDADNDVALSANSATRVPTQFAAKAYIDGRVTGVMSFKGDIDCSTNPNYPAGTKGESYVASVGGKIGGASGKSVDAGDLIICRANNAGGTEAAVGASWFVLEHNLAGALLAANNLADLTSPSTARTNLGLAIGTDVQAWDADLDALAGLAGTNTLYYRSGSGAWSAVTIGTGMAFAGGILSADVTVVTLTGAQTLQNKTLSSPTISGTPIFSGTPGSTSIADVSGAAVSIANGGTVSFPNFSGLVIVNDQGSGAVGLYLCGGGAVAALGASGTVGGAMAYDAGIVGYRFTNTSGGTRIFSFASTRTRNFA